MCVVMDTKVAETVLKLTKVSPSVSSCILMQNLSLFKGVLKESQNPCFPEKT
jgi:hypothetical protein